MDLEKLKARLSQLRAEQRQLAEIITAMQADLQQRQANFQAYGGAIQECEHWIVQLEAPPSKVE